MTGGRWWKLDADLGPCVCCVRRSAPWPELEAVLQPFSAKNLARGNGGTPWPSQLQGAPAASESFGPLSKQIGQRRVQAGFSIFPAALGDRDQKTDYSRSTCLAWRLSFLEIRFMAGRGRSLGENRRWARLSASQGKLLLAAASGGIKLYTTGADQPAGDQPDFESCDHALVIGFRAGSLFTRTLGTGRRIKSQ